MAKKQGNLLTRLFNSPNSTTVADKRINAATAGRTKVDRSGKQIKRSPKPKGK